MTGHRSREVREMRMAERYTVSTVTGEPGARKAGTPGSEGGRWKRACSTAGTSPCGLPCLQNAVEIVRGFFADPDLAYITGVCPVA